MQPFVIFAEKRPFEYSSDYYVVLKDIFIRILFTIKGQLKTAIKCLTDSNLKPKHHFMVHYPRMVCAYGPYYSICGA
ncbi:hypothetical protein Avbf_16851, partial [Armadillidium vulgare]